MIVRVALYPDLRSSVQGDLAVLRPGFPVEPGWRLEGGKRKFIVLLGEGQVVIALGPELDPDFYYHQGILRASREDFEQLRISGGGEVSFRAVYHEGRTKWDARFSGRSGDYGPYDPVVLTEEARRAVKTILGMQVSFEWSA